MTQENDEKLREDRESVRAEMEALLNEDQDLVYRISVVNARIEKLRKVDASIGDLLGDEYTPETIGISDAIRKIFNAHESGRKYSPPTLRDELKESGFDLDQYQNQLAVIHTTLKRLVEQGELKSQRLSNRTYYFAEQTLTLFEDQVPF